MTTWRAGVFAILGGLMVMGVISAPAAAEERQLVLAGGCFWCMQPPYDELEGVIDTEVGFAGGDVEDPTYQEVVAGGTGHLEVVRVTYDADIVDFEEMLDVFWRNIDPLDDGGQFCDRGAHYRAAIFVETEEERQLAESSRDSVTERFDESVVTEIRDSATFYAAEEYHQDYYQKRPLRYRFYRSSCGRDGRLEELWGGS